MMSPLLLLAAGAGCGVGAVLRFLVGRIDHPQSFPWPTIAVNAAGATLLAWLTAAATAGGITEAELVVLGGGLAGGLTTFSSMAVDAVVLFQDGRRRDAALYLAATFAVGVCGAWIGWTLGA
ncbi:CrcB family protein [Demequina sp. NBRC 110054]|uniref:fluoride efflux transporter FluC n=1 Tax=Demequina sp. NBRC 110054 TaxID=1570343 RepID=UPI000A056E99|nr:CrcB family protein [Demequina sp. NBRC 110054]